MANFLRFLKLSSTLGLLILLYLCFSVKPVNAHALQPAYLNLQETERGQFDVSWKVPFVGEGSSIPLNESPQLPDMCKVITPEVTYYPSEAMLKRWRVNCGERGLYGQKIRINGLESALNDVLFRLDTLEGLTYLAVLRASNPSYNIPARGSRPQIAWSYLNLGIQHILTGYDHLLFVLGLVLLVSQGWLLFKTITAFTLAHSVTLGAATLGIVTVPQAPVEAIIALSILFLARELAYRRLGTIGLTARYPWVVALIFGLLHGFGFAGALTEAGLPQEDIPLALLLFNTGVEIGQLSFVFVVLAIIFVFKRGRYPEWVGWLAPYAIGAISAFWVIERMSTF